MPVELRPLGTRCNIGCHYCYQEPRRQAGHLPRSYDIEKMKLAVLAEGGPFSVFGGEPLLVPCEDLEELWAWGFSLFGRNSIQTNGTLITERHIALFKKYSVSVGISIDGPGELNDVRWGGSERNTRALTARTEAAICELCSQGVTTSLIITLHRKNAVGDALERLVKWVTELDKIGVASFRLHLLESETKVVRETYGLSSAENVYALRRFLKAEGQWTRLKLDVFEDMRRMLMGNDKFATCVWKSCDPYTTRAVRGVEGSGQRSNCGRTNKEGIEFVKSDIEGFERSIALYYTPQQFNGCSGCRFFLMCRGHCPGTAIDGDWRNRTEHCEVWMSLFEEIEAQLTASGKTPLSVSRHRTFVENEMIKGWRSGRNPSLEQFSDLLHADSDQTEWGNEFDRIRQDIYDARKHARANANPVGF